MIIGCGKCENWDKVKVIEIINLKNAMTIPLCDAHEIEWDKHQQKWYDKKLKAFIKFIVEK